MQATTLQNRLAKLEINKSTVAYKVLADLANGTTKTYMIKNGNIIRPVYVSGSKRFASNQDHTYAIEKILIALKLKYEFGNDAARGGLTGNYFKILTKIEF